MKILKIFISIILASTLTACAGPKLTRMSLDTGKILKEGEKCPPGEKCIMDYNGGSTVNGGGVAKALILDGGKCYARYQNGAVAVDQKTGKPIEVPCGTKTIVAGINPDRVDVLGGAVIGASAQIGSSLIRADAIKYKARKEQHNGPGVVFVNSNRQSQGQGQSATPIALGGSGGTSIAGASAHNETGVGVGVRQNTGTPTSGGGSCGSPNCYNPE